MSLEQGASTKSHENHDPIGAAIAEAHLIKVSSESRTDPARGSRCRPTPAVDTRRRFVAMVVAPSGVVTARSGCIAVMWHRRSCLTLIPTGGGAPLARIHVYGYPEGAKSSVSGERARV
jgi:hypothetical protein